MELSQFTISPIPSMIYKYHESIVPDWRRPHLGASIIGKKCDREIWYSFRWYKKPNFDGRMLRLFETGQLAEDRIVKELEGIGIKVSRRQEVVSIIPHFGGSIDGVGIGFPESKGEHILEFKTHNKKSWEKLNGVGVQEAKPEHYIQMQTYMGAMKIERAYYIAVNKDTDEIYAERIKYDKAMYNYIIELADYIISSREPVTRISDNPAAFDCKFCQYKMICHGIEAPEKNCRTCQFGAFCAEGFYCSKYDGLVPVEFQKEGCEDYDNNA